MLLLILLRPYSAAFAFGMQVNDNCVAEETRSGGFLPNLGQLGRKGGLGCSDRMPVEGYCEYLTVRYCGFRRPVLPNFHPTKLLDYCRLE